MTQDTFRKACDLDSSISQIEYQMLQVEQILTAPCICIKARDSNGSEHLLAGIPKDSPLRKIIVDTINGELEKERQAKKEAFNKL